MNRHDKRRENLHDLLAFVAVGQEPSFTKAAAKLGVSQSGLSDSRERSAPWARCDDAPERQRNAQRNLIEEQTISD